MYNIGLRHTESSISSRNPEVLQWAKQEGFEDSFWIINSLLKNKPSDEEKIENFLERVSFFAEKLSIPLDVIARNVTDLTISTWQHGVRKLDPEAKVLTATPWEKFYIEKGGQENTPNLKNIDQNKLILNWLVDGIFPLEALKEADLLYPASSFHEGFETIWRKHLDKVALELKYAPLRTIIESTISGGLNGLITGLPAEFQASAGFLKLFGELMTASLSNKTYQKYNYLRGVTRSLAVDLRTVAGRYGQSSEGGCKVNFDVAIGQITEGQMSELLNRLKVLGLWSMLTSLSLTRIAVTLPKKGAGSLLDGLIYAVLGAATIKGSQSGKVIKTLEHLSAMFGKKKAEISQEADENEATASLTGELVGNKPSVKRQAEARDEITRLANIPTDIFIDTFPLVMTQLAAHLLNESFTSVTFALGQVTREATSSLDSFLSHKSNQKSREMARKQIIDGLKSLRRQVTGRLTNESLEEWIDEEVDWRDLPHELVMKKVGVVPYELAGDGRQVSVVKFEEGFAVNKGDIVPVLGGNGSGKSLLMSVLAGETSGLIDETNISWGGQDIRKMRADLRTRMWKVVGSREGQSLRSLLAGALMYRGNVRDNILQISVDKDRLVSWSEGKTEYKELEKAMNVVLEEWDVSIHSSVDWCKSDFRPSGMQQEWANIVFHCLLSEPVNLLIDEVGGKLDLTHTKKYISFLKERSDSGELPGVVFVSVNKDLSMWWKLPKPGYIDMREEIQGQVTSNLQKNEKLSDMVGMDLALEMKAIFDAGKVMSPNQFVIFIEKGDIGKQVDNKIFVTKMSVHDSVELTEVDQNEVREFESGEYGQYLQKCFLSWLYELDKFQPGSDEALVLLEAIFEAVSVIYGRDQSLLGENSDRHKKFLFTTLQSDVRFETTLEKEFSNVMSKFLKPIFYDLNQASGEDYFLENYEEGMSLLRKLHLRERFFEFHKVYCRDSSSASIFKNMDELFEINVFNLHFGKLISKFSDTKSSFNEFKQNILEDLLMINQIFSMSHNPTWFKKIVSYFEIVIMDLDKEQLREVEDRFDEIRLPTIVGRTTVWKTIKELSTDRKIVFNICSLIDKRRGVLLES